MLLVALSNTFRSYVTSSHSTMEEAGNPRRSTKMIQGREREIIKRVIECCDKEARNRCLVVPLQKATERASIYVGVSQSSIIRIRKQSKESPNDLQTTGKKRKLQDAANSAAAASQDRVAGPSGVQVHSSRQEPVEFLAFPEYPDWSDDEDTSIPSIKSEPVDDTRIKSEVFDDAAISIEEHSINIKTEDDGDVPSV